MDDLQGLLGILSGRESIKTEVEVTTTPATSVLIFAAIFIAILAATLAGKYL